MNEQQIRNLIFKTLLKEYEDTEDLGYWSDFDADEFEGPAMQSAMKDIEDSGETFVPLGKSKFEKNLDTDEFKKDLERQKLNLPNDNAELDRVKKNLDIKRKHEKRFGAGSLNENSSIERPKDAEGNPIILKARVEDIDSKLVGHVVRFGVDDDGRQTVHVSWITDFGKAVPKSITYPEKIVVRDKNSIVREVEITDEGIGTSLTIKKGMNVKPTNKK